MHLNLVRSCETPSDPTRCPLPPCCPRGSARDSRAVRAGACALASTRASCASHLASPSGFSLCLAVLSHPMRLSCFVLYLSFVCSMLHSVARSVGLSSPCSPALYLYLFARIACGPRCSAALILAHPVRPVLCLAFCVSMLRIVAFLCCCVKFFCACAGLHSIEFPAIDRPGLVPCSAALPCECIHSRVILNLSL